MTEQLRVDLNKSSLDEDMITSRGNRRVETTSEISPEVYMRILKLLSVLFAFHIFQLTTCFCYSEPRRCSSHNSKISDKNNNDRFLLV